MKKKASLKLVSPSDTPTLNTLIYGPAKSGKTTGAATTPGKTLLVNADRPNASRFAHKQRGGELDEVTAEGLETLIEVVEAVREGEYASIVIDTVGELYRTVLEDLSNRSVRTTLPIYGDTNTHIERFCRALCDLPVNTVFVLHERETDTAEPEFLPYTGTKSPVLAEKLMAMVDVFGYTGVVIDDETKERRFVIQLVDGGGRRGGTRWPWDFLGGSRALDLAVWMKELSEKSAGAGTNVAADTEAVA